MKVIEAIQKSIELNSQVWIWRDCKVQGNPKRDTWIRIDPNEKNIIEHDSRWERNFSFGFVDLTRDDWNFTDIDPVPKYEN